MYDFYRDGDDHFKTGGTEHIVINCSGRVPQAKLRLTRLQHLLNLANAKNALTSTLRGPLWRAYQDCLRYTPYLPTLLSRRAWDVLWKSQYMDFLNMQRRQGRLIQLHADLLRTKRFGLDLAGQVAYRLERKFMAGFQQEALELWKDHRHRYPDAPEFLDTGARLYALEGVPDRAREIMDRLFELEPDWHESVMLVVFRAYTSSQREQHLEQARHMYKAIKIKVGDNGSIEIYDNCLLGFLEARSLPDARRVFRDMVEAGCLDYTGSESQIQQVLRRLNRLYALAPDISSMSTVALDAIAVLPVAYHGHLFSDWMKHSYLQDSPHVVAQILDLMVERGYQPETVHFDFLLRALFRTKKPDDALKAESLGWKMVEEARLFSTLVNRSAPESRVLAIKEQLESDIVLDPDSPIQTPAANTLTFALLMGHHAERSQWEHVDFLTRQLREANVAPDCTIMNVLINNEIRKGQFVEALQIYRKLTGDGTQEGTVFPDGETMRCLWKNLQHALKLQQDSGSQDSLNLPTPRELLRETVEWWRLVRQRSDADQFRRGLIGLRKNGAHRLLLHCFNQSQDLAGALVALHVLQLEWNVYPTVGDVRRLRKQIAWVSMQDQTGSARLQFSLSNNNERNMERLGYTFDRIRDRRLEERGASGAEFPMTEADTGHFDLGTISEFVRVIMLGNRSPQVVEREIHAARQATGVSDLPIGDVSAFDLVEDDWW
ncbi:uncharacterized protein M421DRAFT_54166 [Didymella exigua CBS 183.55]|uniref:Uncharacterized protein n=1 Tax=Didymella exigua CBS 183.55 TaxID=1150837 RepID=A0A6A5RXZ1_9PLEO|nr:uncharacterized protein M421DRAFT_54166 [Didymella exigua CBS 183.55]KAF1932084.1 hypothetical protein M421DRAFT_54166 [Didymella exigua CBS 183.55]